MRPLKVALFVKSSDWSAIRDQRNMGMWSYPVPEFEWSHHYANNFQVIDKAKYKDYDFIFHEDAGYAAYMGKGLPVIYYTFDSFLTEEHRTVRRKQATYADLVLIDHDDLEHFQGMNVRRFPYATNDRLYVPLEKTNDVSFHCASSTKNTAPKALERSALRKQIGVICAARGWSYTSGTRSPIEYAASMGKSKIVVNLSRNWLHRPHRAFDAMACGAAYLTDPSKVFAEDVIVAGKDYATFDDVNEIEEALEGLLEGDKWCEIAASGHDVIMKNHTWTIRAKQLREIINHEFGL